MKHVLCFGRLNVTCAFCGQRTAITKGSARDAAAALTAFDVDHAECPQVADGFLCSACGQRSDTFEASQIHAAEVHQHAASIAALAALRRGKLSAVK